MEYYDPFGDEPKKKFVEQMTRFMKEWSPDQLIQFKVNRIKRQRLDSDRCGYHAMIFLKKRRSGKTFQEATGYKKIDLSGKTEKEAMRLEKKMKKKYPEFKRLSDTAQSMFRPSGETKTM